jgi:hypothetical protein
MADPRPDPRDTEVLVAVMRTLTYDQRHEFFIRLSRGSDQVAVMRMMARDELAYGLLGTSYPPWDLELILLELLFIRRECRVGAEAAARVRAAWHAGHDGEEADLNLLAPFVQDLSGFTMAEFREAIHIPELPFAEP